MYHDEYVEAKNHTRLRSTITTIDRRSECRLEKAAGEFGVEGEVNTLETVRNLFSYVFQDDMKHVELLCAAYERFTGPTLACFHTGGVKLLMEEMGADLDVLRRKHNVEDNLRVVQDLSWGKKAICLLDHLLICYDTIKISDVVTFDFVQVSSYSCRSHIRPQVFSQAPTICCKILIFFFFFGLWQSVGS